MAGSSGNWLLCLLLAASLTASRSVDVISTDPVPDSNPFLKNSVDPVVETIKNRKGHTLQSDAASQSNYVKYPASQALLPSRVAFPPVQQQSIQHPEAYSISDASYLYSNLDDYMNSFYTNKMPKVVEKYSSKLKELMPYIRPHHGNAAAAASRVALVWQNIPSRREIADRTFGAISGAVTAVGLAIVSPVVVATAALFVAFSVILFLFPAVSAFGRRRVGRDLLAAEDLNHHQVFDFDRFLPPEQSKTWASLAARLDSVLDTYMIPHKDDTCLERYYCEVGQMTNRWAKFTEPIITYLEPLVPAYMSEMLAAFKIGARSGSSDCRQMKCSLPFFG